MITHIVLLTPRDALTVDEREAMAQAMERAFSGIPTIVRARVGRRRRLGFSYDDLSPVQFEFLAVLEFQSVDDLDAYLKHPAHIDLGRQFRACAQVALANDFETVEPDQLRTLVDPETLA